MSKEIRGGKKRDKRRGEIAPLRIPHRHHQILSAQHLQRIEQHHQYQYGRAVCRHFDEETELYTLAIPNKEIRVGLYRSLRRHNFSRNHKTSIKQQTNKTSIPSIPQLCYFSSATFIFLENSIFFPKI